MESMATTTTTNPLRGSAAERQVAMTSIESEVREFAREFPTPNVRRAVALCEAGTLSWEQVHELLRRSLGHALTVVGA